MRDRHGLWRGLGLGAAAALLAILAVNVVCWATQTRHDPEMEKFQKRFIEELFRGYRC